MAYLRHKRSYKIFFLNDFIAYGALLASITDYEKYNLQKKLSCILGDPKISHFFATYLSYNSKSKGKKKG